MKVKVVILGILILALATRLYKLDEVPYGLHVDEVKAGWNALSIAETGRDEKGNFWPMYYDSFGDFRPTGLMYLLIPSIKVLGRNILAIRLPSAIVGALTIIPIYLLLTEIIKKDGRKIGLLAALLLALNPWHINLSRATSEGIVAMFMAIFGMYFVTKCMNSGRWRYSGAAVLCFVTADLFYHNIRVLGPIFIGLLIIFKYLNSGMWKRLVKPVISLILVTSFSILLLSSAKGLSRMNQVSLKSDFRILYETTKMPNEEGPGKVLTARIFHNKIASLARVFADEYKQYLGTTFLLGGTEKPVRYMVPQVGLISYIEAGLILLGLIFLGARKELWVILAMLLVAPLPAAVTNEDTPNMMRAIFMIPFLIILGAYGGYKIMEKKRIGLLVVLGLLVLNFGYFGHMYLNHQNQSLATYYRDGGNFELANVILRIKNQYKKIVLSNSPDSLIPWIAYESKIGTTDFNKIYSQKSESGYEYENIIFSQDKCPSIKAMDNEVDGDMNVLYADGEGCTPNAKNLLIYKIEEVGTIKRPDGSSPYILRRIENLGRAGKTGSF